MDLTGLLEQQVDRLVAECVAELQNAHLEHYDTMDVGTNRRRFVLLLDLITRSLREGHAEPIVEYAHTVASERFLDGYDLQEVQTSLNIVEEVLWKWILSAMDPEQSVHATGLVRAILGMTKDAVSRRYVSLAASTSRTTGQ